MAIVIRPFEANHIGAVADFNRRLAGARARWQFPEHPQPKWLAPLEGSPVFQQFLLALEGDSVRGAYALQHRSAAIGGQVEPADTWYLPISEGTIDPSYSLVGLLLVRDALRHTPLSFCLGMNGVDSPLARLAAQLGCELRPVHFFGRIENGARFAREARYLRKRRAVARLLDLAAATGAAALGAGILKHARKPSRRVEASASAETVAGFEAWADELWARCRAHYSFVEARDAATLNRIYPYGRQRLRRLRVSRDGAAVGWAVLQSARMSDNPNFGNLHVGRITDAFAAPEDAGAVIRAATDALTSEGVDLMVSNQSHPAWCDALRTNAFLPAPSNFAFAPSPDLARRIRQIDPEGRRLHLNRGDGDGPWGHDPKSF